MMKRCIFALTFISILIFSVGGCSSGGGDTGVSTAVTDELKSFGEAAKRAGGDFGKLTPEEQQKFITRAGSEEGARAMVQRMAAGPGARGAGQ
ncbi:MAG: hypothetical protein H7Y17_13240 [Chlorobia bacterium]|nr:hypothetical protein [Fimbriimonadaceae bacterium]